MSTKRNATIADLDMELQSAKRRIRVCAYCKAVFTEHLLYQKHLLAEHMWRQVRINLRRCDEEPSAVENARADSAQSDTRQLLSGSGEITQ